jgi:hypothetical protein
LYLLDINCRSCGSRNPENSVLSKLDARLREHDEKNTPRPQIDRIPYFRTCPPEEDSIFCCSLFAIRFYLNFSHEYHSIISNAQPIMINSIHNGCCTEISSETNGGSD